MVVRLACLRTRTTHRNRRYAVHKVVHHYLVHGISRLTVVLECREATFLPALVGLNKVAGGDCLSLLLDKLKHLYQLLAFQLVVVPNPARERLNTARE